MEQEDSDLKDICNNNLKNMPSQSLYDNFNGFIFDKDIKVLGKLLYRYKFFELTKDLPGDIVELGVFKGSGVATFSKFLEIYCPNSNKKIIGFDIFSFVSLSSYSLSSYSLSSFSPIKIFDDIK